MTNGGIADPIALFSPGIIPELRDKDRFVDVMCQFYGDMAGHHDCYITTSQRRFRDAHALWQEDAGRMELQRHPDSRALDHFKDASIISFWLRRMVPINDIQIASEYSAEYVKGGDLDSAKLTRVQAHFAKYGSELCALFAGFYLCLSYEVQRADDNKKAAKNVSILGDQSSQPLELPDRFLDEYPMLMKTKNISAHGLYMMYWALFADIRWRVKGAISH